MTIYEFIKNELINIINENIEYFKSFEDLDRACDEYIDSQYYAIYEDDAQKIFSQFFSFFYGSLQELHQCIGDVIYSVTSAVNGALLLLINKILYLKHEAIDSTLKSSKLSTEEKKTQLTTLLSTSIKEIEEGEPFERFE